MTATKARQTRATATKARQGTGSAARRTKRRTDMPPPRTGPQE